jgi:hypothetical protein
MFPLLFPLRSARARLADLELALDRADSEQLAPYAATAEGWRREGVQLVDTAVPAEPGDDLLVRTRHARRLSAVFFALEEILAAHLTPANRRLIFGRLADTAQAWLAVHQPEPAGPGGLCRAVVREARRYLIECEAEAPAACSASVRSRGMARLRALTGRRRRSATLAA